MATTLIKAEEEHILRVLPILLRRDDHFRKEVSIVLSEAFATKGEINQVLSEIKLLREASDKKFEQVDRRLEQVDRRFEQVQEEIKLLREASDKKFEEINKRFEEHREETNRRFDAMDRKLEDQSDWVGVVVGGLQGRAGRNLEDTIAGTLRCVLKTPELKPEYLMMRKKITDEEGIMGKKGKSYEIDLYVHNSYALVFEIKSYAETDDVERFNDKAEIAKKQFNIPQAKKVFVTLQKGRDMAEVCKTFGIELV
ncbi:MAG: hypothetical protein AB1397_08220 [bacterium]